MMSLGRVVPVVAFAIVQLAAPAGAQLRSRRDAAPPRSGTAGQLPDGRGAANRAQLEQRFRERLYQMTRRRVGLSDAQMNQLVPINQRFDMQRRVIQRQERATRLALRDAMRDSAHVDQSRITGYLDKMVELQRQRIELVAQEQRDLAGFMTPLQRARYTALQEQVRRRIDQLLRQNRPAGDTSEASTRDRG